MYGVEVSPGLISEVTPDAVIEQVKAWQSHQVPAVYPIVWMGAIVVKVRKNWRVIHLLRSIGAAKT